MLRVTGRVALAVLRPLLAPVIIPLIVVIGALVVADQRGVWDADGPLADSGLVDGDGLLVRWRITGNDRLIWKLPFVGSGEAGGGAATGGTSVTSKMAGGAPVPQFGADFGPPLSLEDLSGQLTPNILGGSAAPGSGGEALSHIDSFATALSDIAGNTAPSVIIDTVDLAQTRAAAEDTVAVPAMVGRVRLLDGALTTPGGAESAAVPPAGPSAPFAPSVSMVALTPGAVAGEQATAAAALATPNPSGFEIYFVNGVLNTAEGAAGGATALTRVFNHSVRLIHNHSSLDELALNLKFCRAAFNFDKPQGEEGFVAWAERVTFGSVCDGIDRSINAARTPSVLFGAVAELIRGILENAVQRTLDLDLASSAVNRRLVPTVQESITGGDAVLISAHSQGTMFVNNATAQLNTWWDGLVAEKRACGDAPFASLYISPATRVAADDDAQRYVMMEDDVLLQLLVSPMTPTAKPSSAQEGFLGGKTHEMATYLIEGTESRCQVDDHYGWLREWVLGRQGALVMPRASRSVRPSSRSPATAPASCRAAPATSSRCGCHVGPTAT
ncbi:MAG: hypothetical protein QF664_08765 [Dehalococcoidia bacterium]|nr:hypothetical protein [Dehalococcoidia bacterium]